MSQEIVSTCSVCGKPIVPGEAVIIRMVERPGPLSHSRCAPPPRRGWERTAADWAGTASDNMSYLIDLRRVGNTLLANTFDGWLLQFDLDTGAIIKREFVK